MNDKLTDQLVPTGVLRVGVNMSNFLLVNSTSDDGQPDGVSPAIARAMAAQLGVDVSLVPFKGPGEVADAAADDVWDIANIAAEPERAKTITFSPAYCEIQATYLLPQHSKLKTAAAVDSPGTRIAVKERAAFELWLSDNLKHASLVKEDSHDTAFDVFVRDSLDALAGLRPKLVEQQQLLSGSIVLSDSFTAVKQSIGCRPDRPEATAFIASFVKQSLASGLVQTLIDQYQVTGKLSAASAD